MKFHWGDYLAGVLVMEIMHKIWPTTESNIPMIICLGILVIVFWTRESTREIGP